MKILKFNESFNQNPLWREITPTEYFKLSDNKSREEFTDKEISTIKRLASQLEDEGNNIPKDWSIENGKSYIGFKLIVSNLHIYKLEDEWFLVSETWPSREVLWVADTFEGLLDLIKDCYENA